MGKVEGSHVRGLSTGGEGAQAPASAVPACESSLTRPCGPGAPATARLTLPSRRRFGLPWPQNGVMLPFRFDLGGREGLRAAASHRALGSPACPISAPGEETLTSTLTAHKLRR